MCVIVAVVVEGLRVQNHVLVYRVARSCFDVELVMAAAT